MTSPRQPRAALWLILLAAALVGCSGKSTEPPSQPSRSSASATTTAPTSPTGSNARAQLTVKGHTHVITGSVNCTAQEADPTGTPPRGNLAITASDETASVAMSWLSNAASPLTALTFSYKIDGGDYLMPYYPQPPNVEATAQGSSYSVKGTAPVLPPGESMRTQNLPIEIHVTCP
jgi:Mycobacterium 19 kDa lipoprotein antigen